MRMSGWRRGIPIAALGLTLTLPACVPVTVNVNFSQEKLDNAARQIEDTVAPEERPPAPPARKPSSALEQGLSWLAPREAAAQDGSGGPTPRIKDRPPELVKAVQARRARRPEIREWKSRGCVGETNDALLTSRPGDGCGGEAALVAAENADRLVIYEVFMKQNGIPASDTPRVRAAFTKTRRERARVNDWIQLDDGQWVRKP